MTSDFCHPYSSGFPTDLRHHRGYLVHEERAGEDQDPLGRDEAVEPIDRLEE